MSFLQKSEVRNRQSARRSKHQHAASQKGCPARVSSSKVGRVLGKDRGQSFTHDFNLEHTFHYVTITQESISAGSDFASTGARVKSRESDLNSPSCVYLG